MTLLRDAKVEKVQGMVVRHRKFMNSRSERGFTLLQLMAALAVGMILTAIAIPSINSTLATYRLRAATSSITGAIQSNRYRAIYSGYPYKLTFTNSTTTFQVTKKASTDTSYVNVDGAIPFGTGATLDHDTVQLTFSPSGAVKITDGTSDLANGIFYVSYAGQQIKVTVSPFGSVTSVTQ
jgi:type IV fimbrial biogenesis protein FimT